MTVRGLFSIVTLAGLLSACANTGQGMRPEAQMVSDATAATPDKKDEMAMDGASRVMKLYWFFGGR